MPHQKIRTVTVCGPTASGKTRLGVEIALRLGGEVVSADSMQIYRGMDIANAVPSESEMKNIPHHLIKFLDISENYSVARYVEDAKKCIFDISSRGKLPVIVGGTGLYIDSLLNNVSFLPDSFDESIRKELQLRADREGIDKLYSELQRLDKEAAEKIHPNNTVKIIRALEIYYSTGKTLTQQNILSKNDSIFDNITIGLDAENRDFLYDRINARADKMIENGLLDEAKGFYGRASGKTAVQAIGYKELKPYLDGELPLDVCVENLKLSTRHYAKRQLSWFRRNDNINVFYIDRYSDFQELSRDVTDLILKGWEK